MAAYLCVAGVVFFSAVLVSAALLGWFCHGHLYLPEPANRPAKGAGEVPESEAAKEHRADPGR